MRLLIFILTLFFSTNLLAQTNIIHLNNFVAKSNIVMSGMIDSNNGLFEGNLIVNSNNMNMKGAIVKGSLTMNSKEKTPILYLRCTTKINGPVIFNGKEGIIKKSKDSIIKGTVTNGKVEEVDFKDKC